MRLETIYCLIFASAVWQCGSVARADSLEAHAVQSVGAADGEIFSDGFESGDTSKWSLTVGFQDCDDGYVCTDDAFVAGSCVHTPVHEICDNTVFCDGGELCNVGDPGADPLTGCVSGNPPTCDDGLTCTDDSCNAGTDSCANVPIHGICGNGVFCDGVEACDPENPSADEVTGCVPGPPPTCDDGVGCTVDLCLGETDSCQHLVDHSTCACTESCDPIMGCGSWSSGVTCSSQIRQCGDTFDNDGDCDVDHLDLMCLGPCDDDEDSLDLPQIGAPTPCMSDCFFDGNYSSADDDCYWSHKCDPLQIPPNYYPEGPDCKYDPDVILTGTDLTCADVLSSQSQQCLASCLPITPNGCDCFGCCVIPGAPTPVWLGSVTADGVSTCTLDVVADPKLCNPCTPVPSCFNPCEDCEVCVGKPNVPAGCGCQSCPPGAQQCGGPCGGQCPTGSFCISGCCVAEPS